MIDNVQNTSRLIGDNNNHRQQIKRNPNLQIIFVNCFSGILHIICMNSQQIFL